MKQRNYKIGANVHYHLNLVHKLWELQVIFAIFLLLAQFYMGA